jgi:transposase
MPKVWRFSPEQKKDLETVARTHSKAHVRMKAVALCHLASGKSASLAAEAVLAHRVSVGAWAQRYLAQGAKGLEIARGRGRPTKVEAEDLGKYLRQSPRVYGIELTRWTLSALAQAVPSLEGMSSAGVKKALERSGYSYKRGQPHVHSPDPEYEAKKGRWTKR